MLKLVWSIFCSRELQDITNLVIVLNSVVNVGEDANNTSFSSSASLIINTFLSLFSEFLFILLNFMALSFSTLFIAAQLFAIESSFL